MGWDFVALVFVYMVGFFGYGTWKRDNSYVDIGWGTGFVVIAWYGMLTRSALDPRALLLTGMVTLWGLRLAIHIGSRHDGEDWRYQQFRREWGEWVVPRAFLQVYMLQGAFMLVVALPIMYGVRGTLTPLNALSVLGVMVWAIGFTLECVADAELAQFKRHPEGKLLTSGTWSWSRHPNYFGEALLWWGIGLVAIEGAAPVWTLIGPLTITLLVRYVSGVPFLEKRFADRPGWDAYVRQTSIFIPRPPRD